MEKVPFNKIEKGKFFRWRGKTLWQKVVPSVMHRGAQKVSGSDLGMIEDFRDDTLVTPVNAKIVEE